MTAVTPRAKIWPKWLESPEEWIAFSRLQRARLLYDAGTEFTVSREGRALIHKLLGDGE